MGPPLHASNETTIKRIDSNWRKLEKVVEKNKHYPTSRKDNNINFLETKGIFLIYYLEKSKSVSREIGNNWRKFIEK